MSVQDEMSTTSYGVSDLGLPRESSRRGFLPRCARSGCACNSRWKASFCRDCMTRKRAKKEKKRHELRQGEGDPVKQGVRQQPQKHVRGPFVDEVTATRPGKREQRTKPFTRIRLQRQGGKVAGGRSTVLCWGVITKEGWWTARAKRCRELHRSGREVGRDAVPKGPVWIQTVQAASISCPGGGVYA